MKTGPAFVLVAFIILGMEMACARRLPPKGLQRPGDCPRVHKGHIGSCVERCSGDNSCPRRMKCCSNGCGHVCTTVFHVKDEFGGPVEDALGVY